MHKAIEANIVGLYRSLTTEACIGCELCHLISIASVTQNRYWHGCIGVCVLLPFEKVNRRIVASLVGNKEVKRPFLLAERNLLISTSRKNTGPGRSTAMHFI